MARIFVTDVLQFDWSKAQKVPKILLGYDPSKLRERGHSDPAANFEPRNATPRFS
jgi:hypothetical protein